MTNNIRKLYINLSIWIPLLGLLPNKGMLFSQTRGDTLIELAKELRYSNPTQALKYAHEAISTGTTTEIIASAHYQLGILLRNSDELDSAYTHLLLAQEKRESINDYLGVANTLNAIGTVHTYLGENNLALENYLQSLELRQKYNAPQASLFRIWKNIANAYDDLKQFDSSKQYLDFQKLYLPNHGSENDYAEYYTNYGVWLKHNEQIDSARFYFQSAHDIFLTQKDTLEIFGSFITIGQLHYELDEYLEAMEDFKKAKEFSKLLDISSIRLAKNLHQTYSALNQHDSAYHYLQLQKQLEDSLFTDQQAKHLNLLRTLHEVESTNRQKQLLSANNRALMISLIFAAAIALSLLIGLYLNQRKRTAEKSLLLEREANIQNDMISRLHLQEAEAMQRMGLRLEEEYQKVARSLHDQLGNLLVTARLNIQGLLDELPAQSQSSQQQVRIADQSLETALQAIRQIAHQMHEGRINQLGLASILQELKSTVEASGKLKVELDLIGVEQRLEAKRERQVFQIIRELTTNVIKYAQATELSIQLVQEAGQIEILVADNGQGFPIDFSPQAYGLGLRSVQADLAKLGGTLEIDSHPQHGATIIIDMPI